MKHRMRDEETGPTRGEQEWPMLRPEKTKAWTPGGSRRQISDEAAQPHTTIDDILHILQ